MRGTLLIVTAGLVASALALPSVSVVLESDNGGSGKTNTTVSIEINAIFDDQSKLAGISALYLKDASGVPLDSITCTPFSNPDGTSRSGPTFNSMSPSMLSDGDQVASIVCITTSVPHAPSLPNAPPPIGGGSTTTTGTSGPNAGSTPTGAAATPQSSSTSAGDSQGTGNSASSINLSGGFFGVAAFAAFGVAFTL